MNDAYMNMVVSDAERVLAGARVLLIDDDPDLLEAVREWLSLFCLEVHTAGNGHTALGLIKRHSFDAVLTDLDMPGFDGMQLLSMVKEIDPSLAVVFLSGKGTMQDAILALREGRAFDFLQKPVKDFKALKHVLERAIIQSRQAGARRTRLAASLPPVSIDPLSPRELEVVRLLAEGMDNRQIADHLILGEKTVKNNLTRIYEKLRVSNRTQAVLVCQRAGLL